MLTGEEWFEYLDQPMQELVEESFYLIDKEELHGEELGDYSYVVFPMAKAYEGFLKKYLADIGMISEKDKVSKTFRIGRSMNPGLPTKYRDERWIYDDLVRLCGTGSKLPRKMWVAWKKGRNELFHYFSGSEKLISLDEARERVIAFRDVMQEAVKCMNDKRKN